MRNEILFFFSLTNIYLILLFYFSRFIQDSFECGSDISVSFVDVSIGEEGIVVDVD
jgi:hypothetical protein